MLERLSEEDRLLLATIIEDLRSGGPRNLRSIQVQQGARGMRSIADQLWALDGIRLPWLLNRILSHTLERAERREVRRVTQLVELGVRTELLLESLSSPSVFSSTAKGWSWAKTEGERLGDGEYSDECATAPDASPGCAS